MVASLNRCYGVVVCRADCKDIVAIVTPAIIAPRRQVGKRMNAAGSVPWRSSAFEKPSRVWPTASAERSFWEPPAARADCLLETSRPRVQPMSTILKWALVMLLVSLVAALFGFTGISA